MTGMLFLAALDSTVIAAAAISGAAGILGVLSGSVIEILRSREARKARAETRQQQRDDFQRQNLIDFQEVLGRYVKSIGDMVGDEILAARRQGTYKKLLPSKALNDEEFEASRRTKQLALRIRDDELRARFKTLDDHAATRILLTSEKAAEDFVVRLIALLDATEDRLGEVLRPYL